MTSCGTRKLCRIGQRAGAHRGPERTRSIRPCAVLCSCCALLYGARLACRQTLRRPPLLTSNPLTRRHRVAPQRPHSLLPPDLQLDPLPSLTRTQRLLPVSPDRTGLVFQGGGETPSDARPPPLCLVAAHAHARSEGPRPTRRGSIPAGVVRVTRPPALASAQRSGIPASCRANLPHLNKIHKSTGTRAAP